ncbi:cytotoxic T-lymphocyte protein 4 [Thalassophryne amazonica]|uniref:cytotoxic T-lymphocyte protein 4 n=1 Tax=Thalassophryne amazonica TaxID=390379 RepID=UPI00147209D1|nr:cytotoxic T-lymphocyte protein 4 [Thalassophryne amazonica]
MTAWRNGAHIKCALHCFSLFDLKILSVSRMTAAWCMMAWRLLAVLSVPLHGAIKVIQPRKVLSINGTAEIQCFIQPYSFDYQSPSFISGPEVFRVTLLRGLQGTEELCSCAHNSTKGRDRLVESEEVQCYAQGKGGTVEVVVHGLRSTDTDIYRCKLEVYYPPPYLHITGNGTVIHVLDCPEPEPQTLHIHQSDEADDGDDNDVIVEPSSVPVVILVVLVIFALAVILYIQCGHRSRSSVTVTPDMWHKVDAVRLSCGKTV